MIDKRIELHENVVSTDYIEGNTLHYYTYATCWTDAEHVIKFKTTEQALEWYEKHMRDRVVAQGKAWAEEDSECASDMSNEDYISEWRTIVECVAYC